MGHRLHVAKKYDVQYATTPEEFNYEVEEFHNLLRALSVDYSGEWCDSEFEVSKEELKQGMQHLKDYKVFYPPYLKSCLQDLNVTADEAYDILQKYIDASDPDNEWMHFSFF